MLQDPFIAVTSFVRTAPDVFRINMAASFASVLLATLALSVERERVRKLRFDIQVSEFPTV